MGRRCREIARPYERRALVPEDHGAQFTQSVLVVRELVSEHGLGFLRPDENICPLAARVRQRDLDYCDREVCSGGAALEVKAYRGSPGILDVTGRARGRLLLWQKWSFPFSPLSQERAEPAGWRPVSKGRRISQFSLTSGQTAARGPRLIQEPRCEIELTEVRTSGQYWWTLGFEATGSADLLRSELEATAAVVFAHAMPGGMKPGPDESRSYAQWLGQLPDCENDGDA